MATAAAPATDACCTSAWLARATIIHTRSLMYGRCLVRVVTYSPIYHGTSRVVASGPAVRVASACLRYCNSSLRETMSVDECSLQYTHVRTLGRPCLVYVCGVRHTPKQTKRSLPTRGACRTAGRGSRVCDDCFISDANRTPGRQDAALCISEQRRGAPRSTIYIIRVYVPADKIRRQLAGWYRNVIRRPQQLRELCVTFARARCSHARA